MPLIRLTYKKVDKMILQAGQPIILMKNGLPIISTNINLSLLNLFILPKKKSVSVMIFKGLHFLLRGHTKYYFSPVFRYLGAL